jgi:hypothetical protein
MELTGQQFSIKNFLDKMNQIGSVPPSVGAWELIGENERLKLGHSISSFSHK